MKAVKQICKIFLLVCLYILCIESTVLNSGIWDYTSKWEKFTSIFIIFSSFAEIFPFTVNGFAPSNSTAERSLSHPNTPPEVLPSRDTFFSLLPAAPQSVLLLRLHHGRMPDSLYGNLRSLCLVMLQCNLTFNCTGSSWMNLHLLL